jgi:peptidoglycan hydrolase-like protein with peptidoglycan-binding domain
MVLQSRLFRGDAKLEAAASVDPAHIVPGARGPHVGKIQQALIRLDGATIAVDSIYGPATAAAVLAYKKKRNIINTSRQTQADNIVGTMTMAALDRELLAAESLLSGPARIDALLPGPSAVPRRPGPLPGFKFGVAAFPPFPGDPQIIPDGTPPPAFSMDIPIGGTGLFQVVNANGGTVRCDDNRVGLVSDPKVPNVPGGTMPVTSDKQVFSVKGLAAGAAILEARKSNVPNNPLANFGFGNLARMQLIVGTKVTVAFAFLRGPKGIASEQPRNLTTALATMNRIYTPQPGFTFNILGDPSRTLVVGGLAQREEGTGVFLKVAERTDDWLQITRFRNAAATFNVFFVGKLFVVDFPPFRGTPIALTDTFGKPGFIGRDCIVQDDLRGIDLGLALAHEAGHAFGEDDSTTAGELMNTTAPGEKIPATGSCPHERHSGQALTTSEPPYGGDQRAKRRIRAGRLGR